MSMYAVVLEELRGDNSGKTVSQLAAAYDLPTTAVQDALDLLVRDGRVTNNAGTYKMTTGRDDK